MAHDDILKIKVHETEWMLHEMFITKNILLICVQMIINTNLELLW